MKQSILTLLTALLFAVISNAQNFIRLTDASGITPSAGEIASIETVAQEAINVLPAADRPLFKVYDVGFYIHNVVTDGGIPPVWEQVKTNVENDPNSEFYLIFGRESSSQGLNPKFRVKLKLPTSSTYACLTDEERGNLERYIEQVADDNLNGVRYVQAEVAGLELLKEYFHKVVVCNCTNTGTGCAQFSNFTFLDLQLRGLGFRKKEIQLGGASTWSSGTQGIFDFAGKKIVIDGSEYDIADQVSENKAVFEASSQVLPDTIINTSITGEVYILDNESFTNGEWETAKTSALSHDFVEYWVILTNNSGKSFLYSRYTIGEIVPVAAKDGGNAERMLLTGSPCELALKALGNAAVDAVVQAVIFRIVDPNVHNFYPDAWGKVSYLGAAWEGISSLIPWKRVTNGNDIAAIVMRAATSAFVVVLDNARKDQNYTLQQGLIDFGVAFGASTITQLVFHPKVTAAIGAGSRYARLAFSKGVKRINDAATGALYSVSNRAFRNLTGGITKRVLNATNDATLISRVKALRGKMPSDFKNSGNFGLANVNIPGLAKQEFFAHSKIQDLSNQTIRTNLPEISLKPANEIFPWSAVPNANGIVIDRNIDTEYKILTEIAHALGDNINVSGTIKLFTERDACSSCANVIGLFSTIYKNISVEIIHNNGTILKP